VKAQLLAGLALVVLLGLAATTPASDGADLASAIARDHTVFAVAVKEAGLFELLQGKGEFTVFAPTDAAFDKLGDDKIRAIVKDKALLKKIVLAHVVNGRQLYTKDLVGLHGRTLNGFPVTATKDGVTIGGAKVIRPDTQCVNGVLHAIDTVLIPAE
jgi:uncharacterized surface protein with fasciclin (FAS1) repeats